jgi:hypothetical protein
MIFEFELRQGGQAFGNKRYYPLNNNAKTLVALFNRGVLIEQQIADMIKAGWLVHIKDLTK